MALLRPAAVWRDAAIAGSWLQLYSERMQFRRRSFQRSRVAETPHAPRVTVCRVVRERPSSGILPKEPSLLAGLILSKHRLRQPRPDVLLANNTCRLQAIERKPSHDCREVRLGRTDIRHIGVPKPSVLHDVLSFSGAPEHAVRDRQQEWSKAFEIFNVRHSHTHPAFWSVWRKHS